MAGRSKRSDEILHLDKLVNRQLHQIAYANLKVYCDAGIKRICQQPQYLQLSICGRDHIPHIRLSGDLYRNTMQAKQCVADAQAGLHAQARCPRRFDGNASRLKHRRAERMHRPASCRQGASSTEHICDSGRQLQSSASMITASASKLLGGERDMRACSGGARCMVTSNGSQTPLSLLRRPCSRSCAATDPSGGRSRLWRQRRLTGAT